jgi:hypothetical protein
MKSYRRPAKNTFSVPSVTKNYLVNIGKFGFGLVFKRNDGLKVSFEVISLDNGTHWNKDTYSGKTLIELFDVLLNVNYDSLILEFDSMEKLLEYYQENK